jgi:hypothetical protein
MLTTSTSGFLRVDPWHARLQLVDKGHAQICIALDADRRTGDAQFGGGANCNIQMQVLGKALRRRRRRHSAELRDELGQIEIGSKGYTVNVYLPL